MADSHRFSKLLGIQPQFCTKAFNLIRYISHPEKENQELRRLDVFEIRR